MQQNSFFLGCNYSNLDRTGWSLWPVQDIDTVLTNTYGANANVDDTFSFLYCDLYLRQLKETLKHTMLVHESVFESQIHELHRLYRKQKELMKKMEGTPHWMSSSISGYRTRNEARLLVDNKVEKSEKKVLDLELPVFEYNDMNGEVQEARNDQSMVLESGKQSNKLQLDLNEPPMVEEHSEVFNQFLSSVTSSEGEDSVKGSHGMNEAQRSGKCLRDYGIDLNMSPLLFEEEVTIVRKFETEKPPESLSVLLHGKHGSEQSRVVVQALPCSTNILLLDKWYKPLMRGSRPRKKVKLGPSNKTFEGSELDPHLNPLDTSESQSNQASKEKGSSSSLSKVKSTRNRTNLGKKTRKPQMKSGKGGRIKRKKSRRISLVTEGNFQEISAAEAIVDMSRKSGRETADCITSLSKNLLWFAEISSLVVEDIEIDYSEAMTLQLIEKKLEEHKTNLRLNSSDNKPAVSSIVLGRQRRSRARQWKRKSNDDPSLATFSGCEANEDELGYKSKSFPPNLIEAFTTSVEEKPGVDWGAVKKRRRGSRIPAADFQHMIII